MCNKNKFLKFLAVKVGWSSRSSHSFTVLYYSLKKKEKKNYKQLQEQYFALIFWDVLKENLIYYSFHIFHLGVHFKPCLCWNQCSDDLQPSMTSLQWIFLHLSYVIDWLDCFICLLRYICCSFIYLGLGSTQKMKLNINCCSYLCKLWYHVYLH